MAFSEIRKTGLSPFTGKEVGIVIKPLSAKDAAKHESNLLCSVGDGDPIGVNPLLLRATDHNTIAFRHPNGELEMVEHWFALCTLLRMRLHLHFPNGHTPFSTPAFIETVDELLPIIEQMQDIRFATIDRVFEREFATTEEFEQRICFTPSTNPHIKLQAVFDYSRHAALSWLGAQSAMIDTSQIADIRDVARARTVVFSAQEEMAELIRTHPILLKSIMQSSEDQDPEFPDEILFHKGGKDMLGVMAGIFGTQFAALGIELVGCGHNNQLQCAQEVYSLFQNGNLQLHPLRAAA